MRKKKTPQNNPPPPKNPNISAMFVPILRDLRFLTVVIMGVNGSSDREI